MATRATRLVPLAAVKAANKAAGGHFFSRDATRFFGSRYSRHAVAGPGGTFLPYSNRDPDPIRPAYGGRRVYKVAAVQPSGRIEPDLINYATGPAATAAARARAEGEGPHGSILPGPCAAPPAEGCAPACEACAAGNPPGGNPDLACEDCGHRSCEKGA